MMRILLAQASFLVFFLWYACFLSYLLIMRCRLNLCGQLQLLSHFFLLLGAELWTLIRKKLIPFFRKNTLQKGKYRSTPAMRVPRQCYSYDNQAFKVECLWACCYFNPNFKKWHEIDFKEIGLISCGLDGITPGNKLDKDWHMKINFLCHNWGYIAWGKYKELARFMSTKEIFWVKTKSSVSQLILRV